MNVCNTCRIFDITLSLLALILLSPIFALICLILKFTGEGEIIYWQKTVGKKNNIFYLVKFATMQKNSPNIATGNITVQNDPRVLPVGKFLRSTKINELPQLLNIFFGDMSFVGRRPLTPDLYQEYSEKAKASFASTRPGLTGVGSIVFRSEDIYINTAKNPIEFYKLQILPYKERLELWYLANNNLKIYFMLIFITILVVLKINVGIEKKFRAILPSHEIFNPASS